MSEPVPAPAAVAVAVDSPSLSAKERSVIERFTFLMLIGALGQACMILGTAGTWWHNPVGPALMAAGFGALLMAMAISIPAAPSIIMGRTLNGVKAVAMDGPFAALMVCSMAALGFRYWPDIYAWCWRTSFQAASIGLQVVIGLALLHMIRQTARAAKPVAA
jgi:hypothetical protein